MAVVTKKRVLELMAERRLPFFQVYDGRELVDEMQDESVDLDTAVESLEQTLDAFESGNVKVVLSDKSKADKRKGGTHQNFSFNVRIGATVSGISGTDNATVRALMEQVKNLELKLIEKTYEQRFADLERQIKEKGKSKDVLEHPVVQQVLMGLATNGFGGKAVPGQSIPVHGNPPINGPEPEPKPVDYRKALSAQIQRLAKCDPELLKHLTMLADLAETNPDMYRNGVSMLQKLT